MSEAKSVISMTKNLPAQVKYDPTYETFLDLLLEDWSGKLRLNECTNKPEINKDGKWEWFTDADEAFLRYWFQSKYQIYNRNILHDALQIFLKTHMVNPVQELLHSLQWDKQPRLERFLPDIMKCEDTAAVREISKLIFAGGVRRAFEPGCKFDYMPILIGEQGCGKSTIVEWLGMGHSGKVNTFIGAEAIESLFGIWIGEVDELSAMKKSKDREIIKAFLSTATDSFRIKYEKFPQQIRRRCILIGTTNSRSFLNDMTGNRRFFPVEVHSSAKYLYSHDEEVKYYISQCWAEAVILYKDGKMPKDYNHALDDEFNRMREDVSVEDSDVGMIEVFLNRKAVGEYVCVPQLWIEACSHNRDKQHHSDSQRFGEIMNQQKDWERADRHSFKHYGQQRAWRKVRQE